MGKKKSLIILLSCVLVVTATICIIGGIAAGAAEDKTDSEKMREMADRVESAIMSVDDSYKKQVEVCKYFNRYLRHFRKPKAKTELLTANCSSKYTKYMVIPDISTLKMVKFFDNNEKLSKSTCFFRSIVLQYSSVE